MIRYLPKTGDNSVEREFVDAVVAVAAKKPRLSRRPYTGGSVAFSGWAMRVVCCHYMGLVRPP